MKNREFWPARGGRESKKSQQQGVTGEEWSPLSKPVMGFNEEGGRCPREEGDVRVRRECPKFMDDDMGCSIKRVGRDREQEVFKRSH